MPGRNSQISRIYALLNILEGAPHGLSVSELTDRVNERGHQGTKRTVYRDLDALNNAGFPLFPEGERDNTNGTKWKLERLTHIGDHFVLSCRELLALFLARGVLVPLKETPFFADLEAIFQKIENRLGSRGCRYFGDLAQEIRFEPGPRWGLGIDPDLLETVRACCAERQVLSVTYASANSKDKRIRRLGPHYLYFAKGSLYLVAEDLQDSKVKVFSVPRMSNAHLEDEEYSGEVSDPEVYFKSSFGVFQGGKPYHIRLEFSPNIAPYVRERRWHETQSIISRADGSIIVELDVAISPELIQWVLGFGSDVTVIAPSELRDRLISAASALLEKYHQMKAA